MTARDESPNGSTNSGQSQLVDLVVEDTEAEEVERVRARKEGGDAWNSHEAKHYVRVFNVDEEAKEGEAVRTGFDPSDLQADHPAPETAISDDEDNEEGSGSSSNKQHRDYDDLDEGRNVWGSPSGR